MPEPVSRSVYRTVINMLNILAQQGDAEAIAALARADEMTNEFELIEDDEARGGLVMEQNGGTYLVTEYGASFIPKPEVE